MAAHWPPRRYRANRVPLSHANSPATAVIASRRGLTSNTSWLVFSRTVGVSPLSLPPAPAVLSLVTRHWSSCWGLLFLHFLSSRCPSVPDGVRYHFLFLSFYVWSLPPTKKGPAVPRSRSREHERALSTPRRALVPPPQRAHSRGDRKSTRHARFIFCPT